MLELYDGVSEYVLLHVLLYFVLTVTCTTIPGGSPAYVELQKSGGVSTVDVMRILVACLVRKLLILFILRMCMYAALQADVTCFSIFSS